MVEVLLAILKYSPEQLFLPLVEIEHLRISYVLGNYMSKQWEECYFWNVFEGLLQFFHLITDEGVVLLKI